MVANQKWISVTYNVSSQNVDEMLAEFREDQ
jgi:hypothetical protein